ncbi:hypothetical protein V0R50_17845 [Pseudomonas sp. 148P]|uniref:Integral membrane protein n=1 Tax=Pseudomonas ulcerans TaxID=3115852 RepID=A0ABU7HUA9_9PSED|nr:MULTISPECIES: hypothetical protein [unclassified Pseudomonas]MEE1923919.1 hypothetical protein [Pseudomonas sp. 147P]MEE1935096.1 hypothetical protein [Pseudomonas sp. 148P]
MIYPVLLTLHLFAAIVFIGTVFFEVLFIGGIRQQLPDRLMMMLEHAIGQRARRLMPWVLLVLFGAGVGMVRERYVPQLSTPLDSPFGLLLGLKILVACSVLGHFATALRLFRSGRMTARAVRFIHASVFTHLVLIVLLAKGMFYLSW